MLLFVHVCIVVAVLGSLFFSCEMNYMTNKIERLLILLPERVEK